MALAPDTTSTLDSIRAKLAAVDKDPYALERTEEAKLVAAATKKRELKDLKSRAIDVLESVLNDAASEDVQRKAAVDILSFSDKTKNETPVTEEQLGWLGRVLIEAEEIRERLEISKG